MKSSLDLLPFLSRQESSIESGYEVYEGDNNDVSFDVSNLDLGNDKVGQSPDEVSYLDIPDFPGLHYLGDYAEKDETGKETICPVVSFLYHKTDQEGQLETAERVIIWRGSGIGVHSGHKGQDPAMYMIGPQIGSYDKDARRFSLTAANGVLGAKNFSLDCIEGGILDNPVLANGKS